jgi:SHS family lactate transporter-like MFS transporter
MGGLSCTNIIQCAECSWAWAALDFFTVGLTTTQLAIDFDKTVADITWGLTITLMLRSVGSIGFGLAADRYGRKWLFIVNNVLFSIIQLGTGFCQTYQQFLACRALFGIAMGGIYGNAVVTALEDCPSEARGVVSGLLQAGYTFGFVLATVFARGLVDTTPYGWRPLYWFSAGPPVLFIIFRLYLPETQAFLNRRAVRESHGNATKAFLSETREGLQRHWLLLIYLVFLLGGLEFQTHGNQDLYPTMLRAQKEFSADAVTVTQVVASLGAIAGFVVFGYVSQIFGRRLSMIVGSLIGGALLYPYTFTSDKTIIAPAFFGQFFILGIFGIVPIYLSELSPGSVRTFVVGTTYQLGSLVSSASSTIEATLGERFPLPNMSNGVKRYDYGKVICIFTACAIVFDVLFLLIGPERRAAHLDVESDDDVEEVDGENKAEQVR